MLTQDVLKSHLSYDPETGIFIRVLTRAKHKAGSISGSKNNDGYINIEINQKCYKAHRLAFLYMFGKFPQGEVDHINGIRNDNRLVNLRDVTKAENLQNQRTHSSNNKSGLLGVCLHGPTGRFTATIGINGKKQHIGIFDTKEEAHEVYLTAKRVLHSTCTI